MNALLDQVQSDTDIDRKRVDEAIREAIGRLNRSHASHLVALFLTGEQENKARAFSDTNRDDEGQFAADLERLDDALWQLRSHCGVEAP